MTPIYLDALFLGTSAAAGITSGWWLKKWNQMRGQAHERQLLQMKAAQEKASTKAMVEQLQTLAASVAAQVGEHNSRVQEINSELASPEGQSPEAIHDAIVKLVEANERMQAQLESAEKRLEEKSLEMQSHVTEARTDALTGINNRRAFDEEMSKCLDEYRERGRPSSVMMMDVDFFKKFNDTHGHKAGDEVLKYVAATVKQAIAHTEVVCRYGGEEFAVIFPGTSLQDAKMGAERARAAIGASAIQFEGKSLRVNASAGLAEFMVGESIEAVLKRADDALYVSKRDGRNCGHFHDGRQFIPFVPKPAAAPAAPAAPEKAPAASAKPSAEKLPTDAPVAEVPAAELTKDPLTGLSSRTAFYDDMNRRIAEWKRGGDALSLVLMQIDRMNDLNKTFGEGADAMILKAGAQFMKAACRDMDHLARYDDDSFSLLLPTARVRNAAMIAERLRKAIAKCKLPFQNTQVSFTVSFGVAEAIQGDSSSRLMQRGTVALNTASNLGGNQSCVHNGERAVAIDPAITAAAV